MLAVKLLTYERGKGKGGGRRAMEELRRRDRGEEEEGSEINKVFSNI